MIVIVLILILLIAVVIVTWYIDVKMLEDQLEKLIEKLEQYESNKTNSAGAVPMQLQSERPLQTIQERTENKTIK